jgi:HEAT repeat protein
MEALISAVLNASQPEVRRQADALLPAYGEEAYAWLVSLLHNTSPPVRSNVIAALDAFAAAGPPRPAPPELLRVIARPHERDRDEAVALLARLSPRDPQTWSLLLKVAATPTEWVSLNRKLEARQVASAALSEHAGDPAVALQLAHAVLDNRLAPTAAEAFEHAGDAAAAGAVPALLSVLPDATPNTQVRVLAVIASFGPAARDATGKLQDLLRSPDSSVRIAAAEALAAIGPDAASAGPALAERLGDPDLHVRSAAASALLRTGPGDHDLAADLLAAVRRKDRTLCTILAPSVKLDGATGKRVRPQLADLARHDPDEATRTLAWTALHDMGDPLRWRYSDRRAEGE